jgi:hypothetical protein
MHDYDVYELGTTFYAEVFDTMTAEIVACTRAYPTAEEAGQRGQELVAQWNRG